MNPLRRAGCQLAATIATLCALGSLAYANPCGSPVTLSDGAVSFSKPLELDAIRQADPETTACLKAIAEALAAVPDLDALTASTRFGGGRADSEEARRVLGLAADALAGEHLPRARVSTVVYGFKPGRPMGTLQLAYRTRLSRHPAAQVIATSGPVWQTSDTGQRRPVELGFILNTDAVIETGDGSVARLRLVDGSTVRMVGRAALSITTSTWPLGAAPRIHLRLLKGRIGIHRAQTSGSFEVRTPQARVAIQGQSARIAVSQDGTTSLEVLRGTTIFGGATQDAFISEGNTSRIDFRGTPLETRALLVRPRPLGPLFGALRTGELLTWEPVPEAVRYIVEFARDAQFTEQWLSFESRTPSLVLPANVIHGRWFWRVTAVDDAALWGRSSKIYAFTAP